MKLKQIIAIGFVTTALIGSCLSVSAAPAAKTAKTALTPEQIALILDVESYKQAYPDLAAAFGDDTNAYVEHYLTTGIYEGRTKGVLFDPLTYAEAYADVRSAHGYDITALVNHYVTFGVKENRTMGTSQGYADIAAAERAGLQSYYIPRELTSEYKNIPSGSNASTESFLASHTGNAAGASSAANNHPSVAAPVVTSFAPVASTSVAATAPVASAPVASTPVASAPVASAPASNLSPNSSNFHHTTSIYHDDGETLWRVEYYDENNHLKQYSSVTDVDNSTNSYTENIYSYDWENDKEVLERTDTYVNGVLTSTVSGAN